VQTEVQEPTGLKGSMDQGTPANCNQKSLRLWKNCHSNKKTVKICQEHPRMPSTYPLLQWPMAKQHRNNPGTVYSLGSILNPSSKWGNITSGISDVLYCSKQALPWLDAGRDWAREMNCMIPTLSG